METKKIPACPTGFKHLNEGTFREPKRNEWYINTHTLNTNTPYANFCLGADGLDPAIADRNRWIIVPKET